MRKPNEVSSWVVYQITLQGQPGPNVVCTQGEWEAIEQNQPGKHRLIQGDIKNEGEAERLARGTAGDIQRRNVSKKVLTKLLDALPQSLPDALEEGSEVIAQNDEQPRILLFSALSKEDIDISVNDEPREERKESA